MAPALLVEVPAPAAAPPPRSPPLDDLRGGFGRQAKDGGTPSDGRESQRSSTAAVDGPTPPARHKVCSSDRAVMPPPPAMSGPEPDNHAAADVDADADADTTPKASATERNEPVPTFALSPPRVAEGTPAPAPAPPPSAATLPTPGLMAPPPRPPAAARPPRLSPLPNRTPQSGRAPQPGRQPGTSTLPLPPTHSARPGRTPSRAAVLTPGHSPLDWARLTADPAADLRGVGAGTGYMRVTPSMLRARDGRRGRDAWMALGGRVYNVTPYVPFHPGGGPELLRGAGRDGTRLFGGVHPWVNYEGMLAACLVGILVGEEEAEGRGGDGGDGLNETADSSISR